MVVQWESVNYSHIFMCPPFRHCCVGRCYWRHSWMATKRHLHGVANSSAYSGVDFVVVVGGCLACGLNLVKTASWQGQIFQYGRVSFQWAKLGVGRLGERTAQGLEAWNWIFQTDKHRLCSSVTSPPVWQSGPCHHTGTESFREHSYHLRGCGDLRRQSSLRPQQRKRQHAIHRVEDEKEPLRCDITCHLADAFIQSDLQ